jgi:2-dehydro-3-deoxygalactonokinase
VPSNVILGDWGGSRLRLWLVSDSEIVERREGSGMIHAANASDTLATAIAGWDAGRIVLSGMAGARHGMLETAYSPCPVTAGRWAAAAGFGEFAGRPLRVAAGVACRDEHGRPDVMRGEETQVFGAMALDPALAKGEHAFVLPGTHSKWVRLNDGEIVGFRTFITGELFGALKGTSLFAAGGDESADPLEAGFLDGLARSTADPGLTSTLFEARSAQLCDGKSAGWASGFVSGLLIGIEVAEMAPDEPLTIIGEPRLAARYALALVRAGTEATILDGERCAIAGLRLLDADA